jgi:UDP-N-acetylmuramate dehydrogenase
MTGFYASLAMTSSHISVFISPMPPFLEQNKDLLKYSSFHTPATAQYFFELGEKKDIEKLSGIWKFSQENNLPIIFLGSGTNVVFAFDTFEGIIVRNNLK